MVHRFAASKKLATFLGVALMTALLIPAGSLAGTHSSTSRGTLDVNLAAGMEYLDARDWKPIQSQLVYGVDLEYEGPFWPASLCASLFYSSPSEKTDAGDSVKGTFTSLYLGVRKKVGPLSRTFSPYIQAGIAGESTTIDHEEQGDDKATGHGYWLGGGSYVKIGGPLHLGIDLRYTFGSERILGAHRDIGGLNAVALVGMKFGGR